MTVFVQPKQHSLKNLILFPNPFYMNSVFHYDLLRLTAFKKNPTVRDSIAICQLSDFTLFKFREVNYFNYCMGKIESPKMLDFVRDFYSDTMEKQHQILIDSKDEFSKSVLNQCPDYMVDQKIVVTRLLPEEPYHSFSQPEMKIKEVSEKDICEFAWLYLECFHAENRHPESVEENFLQKLRVEGVKLYFIQWNDKNVGITGLYCDEKFQFLSAGAVKANYRGMGFHKSALSWRVALCRSQNPDLSILSWAYQDSISHKNMIKLGMSLDQDILSYKYVG